MSDSLLRSQLVGLYLINKRNTYSMAATSTTTTRQLLFQIELYTRTKVSKEKENYFEMTKAGRNLFIGHNAIVSMEQVSFRTGSSNERETFFLLALSNGLSYYIDEATVQLLTDTKGL